MVIDLRKGHPHVRNLPHAPLARAARRAAARLEKGDPASAEAAFPLNYCSDVLGTRHFCDSLAKYLGRAYGGPVSPSWLMTTGGVSHGLDLATAALSRPGDTVLCESPTYFLVHQIFADHGLRIESLPTDADGLDTCALEARCEDSGKPPPRLLYLVPSHGNPSGATLPEARRSRLVELARKHGFYVLADEVYQLLDWSLSGPPPRLLCYDDPYRAMKQSTLPTSGGSGGDGGGGGGGGGDNDDDDDDAYREAAPPPAPPSGGEEEEEEEEGGGGAGPQREQSDQDRRAGPAARLGRGTARTCARRVRDLSN